MKIKTYLSHHSRDFTATLECEHCEATEKLNTGYDDGHYHNRVIPAFHCKACGANREGNQRTPEVVDAAHAMGVNGI